ncbi:GrpB family protein [Paenibacillus radicibacter]|uniref:GrpB family protein n=1 Tax=Paenibacillus radicibacter TaxID=2972488 RepID=UPI00358DE72B
MTVVPYVANWTSQFKNEKQTLTKILSSKIALRIEHIGSTASNFPTYKLQTNLPYAYAYRLSSTALLI